MLIDFNSQPILITVNKIDRKKNALIYQYTYVDVQDNKKLSLHIPVCMGAHDQPSFGTLDHDRVRVLFKDPSVAWKQGRDSNS